MYAAGRDSTAFFVLERCSNNIFLSEMPSMNIVVVYLTEGGETYVNGRNWLCRRRLFCDAQYSKIGIENGKCTVWYASNQLIAASRNMWWITFCLSLCTIWSNWLDKFILFWIETKSEPLNYLINQFWYYYIFQNYQFFTLVEWKWLSWCIRRMFVPMVGTIMCNLNWEFDIIQFWKVENWWKWKNGVDLWSRHR